eukprot:4658812-Prymnesium_polylepis.1
MRFCSPLGATSACMGGGRGGERALSGEGAREGARPRSREGALSREPWEWRESPEGESPELV